MIMLCTFDTVYVLLNILLFALPKMWTSYESTGTHYYVLPKAIPFGMNFTNSLVVLILIVCNSNAYLKCNKLTKIRKAINIYLF